LGAEIEGSVQSFAMAGKIKVLPQSVAQSIAAGEVVERPASAVKELVENAIDAGSSEIVVELQAGGLQLIRVQDNGEGIEADDVPLALQRYATSKISDGDDLFRIHTLGFRGEALPSIASVSRLTLKTRVPHSLNGTEVFSEGGEIKKVRDAGLPVGTEVTVENLFYNVPVKRKFLKSIRSELRHVLGQFLRLSLSHPSISFKLIHDGRILQDLVGTDSPSVRIEAILGKDVHERLRALGFEDREIKADGFAGLPSLFRGDGNGIYLYVNGRYIKDRMIYRAITEAYRHVIPSGKFPVVVLFLRLPPQTVDVNVHPTKAEVKFRDPERVFRAAHGALASMLGDLSPLTRPTEKEGGRKESTLQTRSMSSLPLWPPTAHPPSTFREEEIAPKVKERMSPEWERDLGKPLRLLGQVYGTYLVCEGESGLIFIDQHAAHERLLYERYKQQFESRSVPVVRLLLPVLLELPAEESFILESSLKEFQSIGFEIDPAGQRTYALRSIPAVFDQMNPQRLFREILHDISFQTERGKATETLENVLLLSACHAAIRGEELLKPQEMEELVRNLMPFHLSMTCPHGRPIFFSLTRDELNRQFRRTH
jgi:DNA mismatch repair protein MutL